MRHICIILFTAMLATQAWAETTFEVGNLKYTVIEGTTNVSVSRGSTPTEAPVIPGKVTNPNNEQEYSVTSIGEQAFYNCSSLTSVTIPNSVTSIGSGAFSNCNSLEKAEFASIESLCGIDFGNYSANPLYKANHLYITGEENEVTELTIPSSVTSIGNYAFTDCSGLTSVTIPNTVTSIGEQAFYNCSGLTTVTIPNSVTIIGDYVFYNCSSLTSVTIPNSVTSIANDAFDGCSGLTSVTIPNSVTSISDRAFQGCSGLTSVTIPNSVTSISDRAFESCSGLTSVTIPNSVTSIGEEAFYDCTGLTSVTIPNSVKSISDFAFYNCGSAILYCEVEESSKPAGWNSDWNYDGGDVKWGCKVVRVSVNNEEYGSVTANDDAAAVKADDGSLWYLADATNIAATLIATPAEGYHFVQWEDDANAAATRTVTAALSQPYKAIFAKDEPTAISTTEQNSLAVSAYGRNILVKNATGEVLVYDTTGRLIAREMPSRRNVISVAASGIYVVKVGNTVKRVLVK